MIRAFRHQRLRMAAVAAFIAVVSQISISNAASTESVSVKHAMFSHFKRPLKLFNSLRASRNTGHLQRSGSLSKRVMRKLNVLSATMTRLKQTHGRLRNLTLARAVDKAGRGLMYTISAGLVVTGATAVATATGLVDVAYLPSVIRPVSHALAEMNTGFSSIALGVSGATCIGVGTGWGMLTRALIRDVESRSPMSRQAQNNTGISLTQ